MATTFGGDVIVGGNIAVGGFVVSGTLSSGTTTIPSLALTNSLTIGDIVVQPTGTTLDFSGPTITGLTLCGAAIGGGVTDPLVVTAIDGLLTLNGVSVFTNSTNEVVGLGTNVFGGASVTTNGVALGINAGSNNGGTNVVAIGVGAGTGNAGSNCIFLGDGGLYPANSDSDRFVVYSTDSNAPLLLGDLVGKQLSIGTNTLSGALNVKGVATVEDLYITTARQPMVQFGVATISSTDTSTTVPLPVSYPDTGFAIQITGADSNVQPGIWAAPVDATSFTVVFGANPPADATVYWTTFGRPT
jgi:hypothetical protein